MCSRRWAAGRGWRGLGEMWVVEEVVEAALSTVMDSTPLEEASPGAGAGVRPEAAATQSSIHRSCVPRTGAVTRDKAR